MADHMLVMVLDEVRGKTINLLAGVTEEQARWAPPGLHNSILWHAGHAHCLLEWLGLEILGRPPQMPPGWMDMFSWASRPAEVAAARWPKLAEVVSVLEAQHKRAREVFAALGAAELARIYQKPQSIWNGKPIVFIIFHGLHDEAMHGGEVHLLRKLQGI
jgi:hypothetical protein